MQIGQLKALHVLEIEVSIFGSATRFDIVKGIEYLIGQLTHIKQIDINSRMDASFRKSADRRIDRVCTERNIALIVHGRRYFRAGENVENVLQQFDRHDDVRTDPNGDIYEAHAYLHVFWAA